MKLTTENFCQNIKDQSTLMRTVYVCGKTGRICPKVEYRSGKALPKRDFCKNGCALMQKDLIEEVKEIEEEVKVVEVIEKIEKVEEADLVVANTEVVEEPKVEIKDITSKPKSNNKKKKNNKK